MSREIVRNLGSRTTHLMDVTATRTAVAFWTEYQQPYVNRALCGVKINDGVVMWEGTKVKCRACRYLGETE